MGYGLVNLMAATVSGFGIYFSGVLRDLKIDLHIVFDIVAPVSVMCAIMFCFVKQKATSPRSPDCIVQP